MHLADDHGGRKYANLDVLAQNLPTRNIHYTNREQITDNDPTEDTKATALSVLEKGLNDLIEACDVVEEKFTEARDGFDASRNGDVMEIESS